MLIIKRSLDADRDGKPEQIRYVDKATGEMVRKEIDRDYDGMLDAWQTYSENFIDERTLDTNNDGHIDTWERYSGRRMVERVIDRNGDEFEAGPRERPVQPLHRRHLVFARLAPRRPEV